jgi:hypothetical protein
VNTATFGRVILVRVNENMYTFMSAVLCMKSVEKNKYIYSAFSMAISPK